MYSKYLGTLLVGSSRYLILSNVSTSSTRRVRTSTPLYFAHEPIHNGIYITLNPFWYFNSYHHYHLSCIATSFDLWPLLTDSRLVLPTQNVHSTVVFVIRVNPSTQGASLGALTEDPGFPDDRERAPDGMNAWDLNLLLSL